MGMEETCKELFADIKINEPLEKYSTLRIGGPADYFYQLKDEEELPKLVDFCRNKKIPMLILGGGSNVLFDDKGFRGMVIKIETEKIKFDLNRNTVTADAGVPISKLLRATVENGLSGLEKWMGLPGSVGGAVRGNAGCNGLETKDILRIAKIFDLKDSKIKEFKKEDLDFSYRNSKIKNDDDLIVISAIFQLKKREGTEEEQRKKMMEIAGERGQKQVYGLTAGSFFKNPSPENPAGMLIEQAGLKGKTIGKAQISEKHANFFINKGGATAKDMIELANLAKSQVKAKFGIELEEEVRIFTEKNGKILAEKRAI